MAQSDYRQQQRDAARARVDRLVALDQRSVDIGLFGRLLELAVDPFDEIGSDVVVDEAFRDYVAQQAQEFDRLMALVPDQSLQAELAPAAVERYRAAARAPIAPGPVMKAWVLRDILSSTL